MATTSPNPTNDGICSGHNSHFKIKTPGEHRRLAVVLGTVLFVVWLLWSGHYTGWLIACGLGSSVLVVLVCIRMNIVDEEGVPMHLGLHAHLYGLWLAKQIDLANIDVARRVLDPRLPIQPMVIRLKASQRTDLARVIYANSVTLTPGTVCVSMESDEMTVHALTRQAAAEDKSGEMDRRVLGVEARG